MRDDYDRSSKYLLERFGGAILRLAGLVGVWPWRAVPPEVVQPRQLPDGLLEVEVAGQTRRHVVEIATFPERRAEEQALRDALLVYLHYRELPEVVTLVLRPKGQFDLSGTAALTSTAGWTGVRLTWRVVKLWEVPAADLLAAGDVGLIPWVPLARIDGPPGPVLQQCRQCIDQQASPDERENLLAVIQVLGRLRYDVPLLTSIFGGRHAMIESPLIKELVAESKQEMILKILVDRFGPVPADITAELLKVDDYRRLDDLGSWAARSADLAAFHSRLTNPPPAP
jgi:hypothetical protein